MKVVINKCYGGFSLSPEAVLWLFENGYEGEDFKTHVDEYWPNRKKEKARDIPEYKRAVNTWEEYLENPSNDHVFLTIFTPDRKYVLNEMGFKRDDKLLVECVEKFGEKANGRCAELHVVEIPDGTEYIIDEYDGMEHIAETHRTWG